MTDAEIICTFMESPDGLGDQYSFTPGGWWERDLTITGKEIWTPWRPVPLTLDRLRLVESKLIPEHRKWNKYCDLLRWPYGVYSYADATKLVHASPESKIAALAAVLKETKCRASG